MPYETEHWTLAGVVGILSATAGGLAIHITNILKERRLAKLNDHEIEESSKKTDYEIEESEKDAILTRCEKQMAMLTQTVDFLSENSKKLQGDVRQLQRQHKECEENHRQCELKNNELQSRVTQLETLLGAK